MIPGQYFSKPLPFQPPLGLTEEAITGVVPALARSAGHTMSKPTCPEIRLLAGLGVESDAHQGVPVKHRSRAAQGNLVRKAGVMSIARRAYLSSLSISSMTLFISLIAARNGADVVMSTPAPLSRSIGYFELPEDSIRR